MNIPRSVLAKMALGAAGLSPLPFMLSGLPGNAAPHPHAEAAKTPVPAPTATPASTATPSPTATPKPVPRVLPHGDLCIGCGRG